jgi:hypothetical protein
MTMKGAANFLVAVALLYLGCSLIASAYDPSPLQDFCVATDNSPSAGTYLHSFSYFNCFYYYVLMALFHFFITSYQPINYHEKCPFLIVKILSFYSIYEWKVLQAGAERRRGDLGQAPLVKKKKNVFKVFSSKILLPPLVTKFCYS